MFKTIAARLQQGYRTFPYPKGEAVVPDRLRGLPVINQEHCSEPSSQEAIASCPSDALSFKGELQLDMGRCIFCGECENRLPEGALQFSNDHRLSTSSREDLLLCNNELKLAKCLDDEMKRLFGRSLQLRQVSAGGCNACEADINVLGTLGFDLGRFGIKIVASPRHADGVLVTGPVTENMKLALMKTYDAVPDPKLVIAVGACAISGGMFRDHIEVNNGTSSVLPVDLYIPGCPPHPLTILDGFLRLLDKL